MQTTTTARWLSVEKGTIFVMCQHYKIINLISTCRGPGGFVQCILVWALVYVVWALMYIHCCCIIVVRSSPLTYHCIILSSQCNSHPSPTTSILKRSTGVTHSTALSNIIIVVRVSCASIAVRAVLSIFAISSFVA